MKLEPNRFGKVWLNCASSINVVPDFINLDNHIWLRVLPVFKFTKGLIPSKYRASISRLQEASEIAPIVKHDCIKPLPSPDNSIDHVLCSHFLEHVYPEQAQRIVNDFFRALKPGGTVHLIVPDLKLQIQKYQDAKSDNTQAADNFMEEMLISKRKQPSWRFQVLQTIGNFGLDHKWMYDQDSLTALAQAAGFEIQKQNETPSKEIRLNDGESAHVVGVKPIS